MSDTISGVRAGERTHGAAETAVAAGCLLALTSAAHTLATDHRITTSGLLAIGLLALSLARAAVHRPTRGRVLALAVLSQLAGHVFLVVTGGHGEPLLPEPPMAAAHLAAALLLGEVLLRSGRAADAVRAALRRVVALLVLPLPATGPAAAVPVVVSPPGRPRGWCGLASHPRRGPPA